MSLKKIKELDQEDYLKLQIEKTSRHRVRKKLLSKAVSREAVFKENFEFAMKYRCIKAGKKALCLGSRMGEEVRALKSLGVDAVGVDLVECLPDVIEMNFEDLQYEGEEFDIVYSNSMDHTSDIDTFLEEAVRVLKHKGYLILDVMPGDGNVGTCEMYELDVFEIMQTLYEEFAMEIISLNANLKRMYRGNHKSTQLIFRKGTKLK